MAHNFVVGQRVRMTSRFLGTLSDLDDRAREQRRIYTVTAIRYPFGRREGQYITMECAGEEYSTTARWLEVAHSLGMPQRDKTTGRWMPKVAFR